MTARRKKVMVGRVERYRANPIVRFLLDEATAGRRCDLNLIWVSGFSLADLKEFYQLIGYSVSGYRDVFSGQKAKDFAPDDPTGRRAPLEWKPR